MAEGELTMFGKAYNTVGSADKNLVLLTRGDLKIRWGNKYIDLIKNGKINADVDILKKIDDKDSIVKDGIYLIEKEEGSEVWLYVNGTLINLLGEVGTTYVSFIGTLDVDAKKRYQALINAGFYYATYEEASQASIESGLIYIVDQQLLYYAKDGQLTKYEAALTVPDPLRIGNLVIDGKASRIYGATSLGIGLGDADYISMTDTAFNIHKPLTTYDIVSSNTFQHTKAGYSIYYDPVRNWHCMELDYIYIRNLIEYDNIKNVKYEELLEMVTKGLLVKGMKYRITDFQNEFEIEDVYNINGLDYIYYWPVIVTAKNTKEFEKEGYFCDNELWIIEYDVNFHYYVSSGRDEKGQYWLRWTKGRITKLTDEYGNVGNYDFKHRTFNTNEDPTNEPMDIKARVFTFNALNTTCNRDEEHPNSFVNIHQNYDVSLVKTALYNDTVHKTTVKVKNNTVYILEPTHVTRSIQDANGNTIQVEKLYVYDEYIVFPNCTESLYPYNNTISRTIGRYIVTGLFYGNTIKALISNKKVRNRVYINYNFYNNTTGTLYMLGDDESNYPEETEKKIEFAPALSYYDNTMGDVVNSKFSQYLVGNTFLDIKDTIIVYNALNNYFASDLIWVRLECPLLINNKFNGLIDTEGRLNNANRETYGIFGNLVDNEFGNITKCYINGELTNNKFGNIIPTENLTLSYIHAKISNCIFRNLIGVTIFDSAVFYVPTLSYVLCYDDKYNIYYDIENTFIKYDMYKVTFKGNVINTTFTGSVEDSTFNKPVGTNGTTCMFKDIKNSTFSTVKKLNALNGDIHSSTFSDEITDANIYGTLDRCSFVKLQDGIEVGETGRTLTLVDVLVNVSPNSASKRESWTDAEIAMGRYVYINPLKINITTVPKLGEGGAKNCYIQTIDGAKVFIVQLSSEDNNPRGTIIMFYPGEVLQGLTLESLIPKGYHICDGTEGTPNLIGKFIRSASNINDIGSHINTDLVESTPGGRVDAIRIGVENLPPHTHTFSQTTGTISGETGTSSVTGITNVQDVMINPGSNESVTAGKTFGTYSDDHKHSFSGEVTFTPSQLTDTFANEKIKIEPDAYALIFIMKL